MSPASVNVILFYAHSDVRKNFQMSAARGNCEEKKNDQKKSSLWWSGNLLSKSAVHSSTATSQALPSVSVESFK